MAIKKAAERFALLDHSPIGHFVLSSDFTVLFWNKCLEAWTGIPREEIAGENIVTRFPHLGGEKYASRIGSMFTGGPPTIFSSQLHRQIIPAPLPGGKFRFQYTVVTAVPGPDQKSFFALFSIQDVTSLTEAIENHRIAFRKAQEEMTERNRVEVKLVKYTEELQRLNKALKERSIRDGLTGLFNHRYFYYVLRRDFLLVKRSYSDLACLLLDLDHFKRINDTHGHQFGDTVLKKVAARIRSVVRETDLVSRYGGEEFAILLPDTDLAGAQMAAEKIRARIGNRPFPNGSLDTWITVSIGLATVNEHRPATPQDLLAFADKALYEAKAGGRNRVTVYSAEEKGNPVT
ncbi:MAG TPA: diguanylate cyclase [Geobacteraceae bacterium]